MFYYKQKEFIYNDELSWKLNFNYTLPCFQLTYKSNIRIAKQRILQRNKINVMVKTTKTTELSINIHLTACILNKFWIYETTFILFTKFYVLARALNQNESSCSARDLGLPTTNIVKVKLLSFIYFNLIWS